MIFVVLSLKKVMLSNFSVVFVLFTIILGGIISYSISVFIVDRKSFNKVVNTLIIKK